MRIAEVERKDIAKLNFDLRDKPYQANRTLGCPLKDGSRSLRSGACGRTSPIPAVTSSATRSTGASGSCRRRRSRRLGEVLREAESEMPSAVAAFRLLLLTGCRLSEIQFLRWECVKDDCIELPDAKTGGTSGSPRSRGPRRAGGPAPRAWQSLGHFREEAGDSHLADLRAPLATHPRAGRAWRTCEFMTSGIRTLRARWPWARASR